MFVLDDMYCAVGPGTAYMDGQVSCEHVTRARPAQAGLNKEKLQLPSDKKIQ